jgi:DNA-directed RNA polymerase specialized sigma24 family protein
MVDDGLVDERAEQRSAAGLAQARLFDEQRTGLTRLALLLAGSRPVAEELVQDAFEQVVRRWDVIHTPAGYVRSAVISGARSWGRRRTPPPLDRRDVVRLDEEAVAGSGAVSD